MILKLSEGYDTVYATRSKRKGESLVKRFTAKSFYIIYRRIAKILIPADTGDFRVINRRTIDSIKKLREYNRFMKGIFSWVGFKQTGIFYDRDPRAKGQTKWNYFKLFNFAIEGITSFSYLPLQISSYIGLATSFLAFVYGFYLFLRTIIFGTDVPGYASIMVAILFFSGLQLLFLGIIGEYVGRVYLESKHRPLYIVKNYINFDSHNDA
jgi:glycosyltransferase involved in cell wall biosynthesis